MNDILSFAQNHMLIVIVLALVLLYFTYRKPKLFFGIFLLGAVLVGFFYLITSISGPAKEQKKKLIREEKQLDTDR
jgi:lipopolysaccharide export LptBFGC system permease protein LptF